MTKHTPTFGIIISRRSEKWKNNPQFFTIRTKNGCDKKFKLKNLSPHHHNFRYPFALHVTAIDGWVDSTTGFTEKSPGQTRSGKPDVCELAGVLIHRERIGNRPGSVQNRAHRFMVVLKLPNELPAPAVLMHPREGAGTAQRECRRPTPALPRGRRVCPCLIILTILTADLPHLVHSHSRTRKRNATIRF